MAANAPPANGPLQNMYYKRPVGTAKPCAMCYRETKTVLWNPQDFLYTCDMHLTDSGFASPVEPAASSSSSSGGTTVNEEEIKRIKEEWEERQRKKKEAAAAKEKEKATTDGDKDKAKEGGWLGWMSGSSSTSTADTPKASSPTASGSSSKAASTLFQSPNSAPTHQRFTLNRQIFAMRQAELRKKRQTSQVNAVAPRLPVVPSMGLS